MRTALAGTMALLALLGGNRLARAQEIQLVSANEFNSMAQRMAEYEQRLAACENKGTASCSSCCFDSGIVAGAELLMLKPFQSEGESPGFDYDPASRIWLGWTGSRGIGFRVRWFQYDHQNPANIGTQIEDINLTVLDAEITDQFRLGRWQGLLAGGLRYADYNEFGLGDADQMSDSFGLLAGLELRRPVTDALALFGSTRGSIQFADDGLDNDDPVEDLTFAIAELQLGLEWRRGNFFVRGAAEAQYWTGGVIGDGDTEALSLFGGSLALGIAR